MFCTMWASETEIPFAGRKDRMVETRVFPLAKVEEDPQRPASYWTFIAISRYLAEKMAVRQP